MLISYVSLWCLREVPLLSFRMGVAHQKDQLLITGFGFLSIPSDPHIPLGRGKELEIEFSLVVNGLIKHAYVMKPQWQVWTAKLGGALQMVNTHKVCWEGAAPRSHGERALGSLCSPTPTPACPCISSLWLFLSCIHCNKTVIVSIVFFWVLWVLLVNY